MNTKLTLRLDDELICSAKRHADHAGTSVSRLVANYFALLAAADRLSGTELTPRVRSLLGALASSTLDEPDYRRHLEEKHG